MSTRLEQVFAVFAKHGLKRVIVTYSGGGDSGDSEISEIERLDELEQLATGADGSSTDISVAALSDVVLENQEYNRREYNRETREWIDVPDRRDIKLGEFMIEAADHFVDMRHGGWANNEGGRGQVTFEDGKVLVEHVDFYQKEEEDTYSFQLENGVLVEHVDPDELEEDPDSEASPGSDELEEDPDSKASPEWPVAQRDPPNAAGQPPTSDEDQLKSRALILMRAGIDAVLAGTLELYESKLVSPSEASDYLKTLGVDGHTHSDSNGWECDCWYDFTWDGDATGKNAGTFVLGGSGYFGGMTISKKEEE